MATLVENVAKTQKSLDAELIDQFYLTLEASFTKARQSNPDFGKYPESAEKIQSLLDGQRSWKNAYQIEELLVSLYSDDVLAVELDRRIQEAPGTLGQTSGDFYAAQQAQAQSRSQKEALLERLLNDLHWRYQNRQLARIFVSDTRIRTGLVFILSVATLFSVNLFSFGDIGNYLIVSALAAGWMGANFSMLLSLRSRLGDAGLDDLRVQRRYSYLVYRGVVGIGAAFIFYYFLRGELITGTFFPDLTIDPAVGLTFKNYSLLIVWSFVAGFSEKLVPNMVAQAAEKAEVKSA